MRKHRWSVMLLIIIYLIMTVFITEVDKPETTWQSVCFECAF